MDYLKLNSVLILALAGEQGVMMYNKLRSQASLGRFCKIIASK